MYEILRVMDSEADRKGDEYTRPTRIRNISMG